jgi:hypothetical protein
MTMESIAREIRAEIARLGEALRLIEGTGATRRTAVAKQGKAPRRGISAAGRKRIAAAQRARWAKVRAGKK